MQIDGNDIRHTDLAWACEEILNAENYIELALMTHVQPEDKRARARLSVNSAKEAIKSLRKFIKSVEPMTGGN